jgi:hypothetical protein
MRKKFLGPVGQVTFSRVKKPIERTPQYFYLSEGQAHGH